MAITMDGIFVNGQKATFRPEDILSDDALANLKNNYVTPQMYGAQADGETDDTQAIQDALDSGYDVYFPNGTYMTSGVSISSSIIITFDNATLKANTYHQDYVISTTIKIIVHGRLTIDGDNKAYCGFKFASAYQSILEWMLIKKCLIWGVYLPTSGAAMFDYLQVQHCGQKMEMTISSTGASSRTVNIDSTLTEEQIAILTAGYDERMFIYDTSGYSDARYSKIGRVIESYDAQNNTLYLDDLGTNRFKADYLEKTAILLVGGGLCIGEETYMQVTVGMYNSAGNAIGIDFVSRYGHQIVNFYSQDDSLPIFVPSYSNGNHISSMTVEGHDRKSSYIAVAFNYDRGVIDLIGTNGSGTYKTNELLVFATADKRTNADTPFMLSSTRRCVPNQYDQANIDLSELSSDVICSDRARKFTIRLKDTYSGSNSLNFWGVKTIYFMPRIAQNNNIEITLHNETAAAGFSLNGATNNVLTIARPGTLAEFKLIIILKNTTFKVYIEDFPTEVTPVT